MTWPLLKKAVPPLNLCIDGITVRMWLDGLNGNILYATGRPALKRAIKTSQIDVPIFVSRSGLTQHSRKIARQVGMTMIGRAQCEHYVPFTGAERFIR